MQRLIILHHIPDWNDLPNIERWFYRYHIPDVLRTKPWMSRYVMFRSTPPPSGAEAFGYYNYKVHENWSFDDEDMIRLTAMTPEVAPLKAIMVKTGAKPTEDFLGSDLIMFDQTILRWLIIFKYPEGVSLEEGDHWYLNTHVPEALQQPGLIRFFSYKVIPLKLVAAVGKRSFLHPQSEISANYHRVTEMWYTNSNGWVDSVIKNPPKYTRPDWANYNQYPFLKPWKDFHSTCILERPTEDYLKDVRPFYI